MKLSIIAAISKNYIIGYKQKMPWHLPPDLQYFKQKTMGHYILMGRTTYESLPHKLEGRKHLVLSHSKHKESSGVEWFTAFSEAVQYAKSKGEDELFIIGGATIFSSVIHLVDYLYITDIEKKYEGDSFFPRIEPRMWQCVHVSPLQKYNETNFRFKKYQKRRVRLQENA